MSTNHPKNVPMEKEDNDWVSLDTDARVGDINDGYNIPSWDPPTDFEQANFEQFMVPEDLHFLVTPTQATATAARCVEVTLLKTLTELKAPSSHFGLGIRVCTSWV
jgi:hypothetical protein